jgi:hypothetical protein
VADESVAHNLERMDELDFAGWNGADWEGVFTRYHTDDVLVDVHGQAPTHGIREHIQAMKALVESTVARPSRSSLIPSGLDQETGPAWSASSRTVAGW